MNEAVIKHLEMIQSVITRMASNSFMLKGWAVTIAAALFTLSAVGTNPLFFAAVFLPILLFWGLDSYYLMQERMFRVLYDYVRQQQHTDFSMKWDPQWASPRTKWVNCLLSVSEAAFYLPLAVLSILLMGIFL